MACSKSSTDTADDYQKLFAQWQKQYSKKRQLHYFFNSLTNESVWTVEEVNARIDAQLKKQRTSKKAPDETKPRKEPSQPKVTRSKSTHDIEMGMAEETADTDEDNIPMEIDDIVENVLRRLRFINMSMI
jgi:hypothetical protein